MSESLNRGELGNTEYEKWKVLEDDELESEYEKWKVLEDDELESEPEELPSPESKIQNLTFEKLSELSTDEYLELWRTLNPFYVTHVTRQGIRDHNAMLDHSAGKGKLHNGFEKVLEDGKCLHSPMKVNYDLPENFVEEDVEKALEKMVFSKEKYDGVNPEIIIHDLPVNSTIAATDPWGDKRAIHFAQHTVLDDYYGGESGNEIFYVFPTDVIASQCRFGGHTRGNLNTAQVTNERKWNDLFVWSDSGEIPLDAGLVFLPESQMVDRKNGSRYSLKEVQDESGRIEQLPEKDEERIRRFSEWIKNTSEDSPEFMAISERKDYSILEDKLGEIGIPERCWDSMARYSNHRALLKFIKERDFGTVRVDKNITSPEEREDLLIRKYLEQKMADLKYADDTVTAREYWEGYFAEHPEQRPAHIIYYDGDPSEAVRSFLEEHGILEEKVNRYSWRADRNNEQRITGPGDTVERDGDMLGFESHYVSSPRKDYKIASEKQRFNEMALKILEKRFAERR